MDVGWYIVLWYLLGFIPALIICDYKNGSFGNFKSESFLNLVFASIFGIILPIRLIIRRLKKY